MKLVLIYAVVIICLASQQLAWAASSSSSLSSEEADNDELSLSYLSNLRRVVRIVRHHYPPPIYPPIYPPVYPPRYPPVYYPNTNNCQTCTMIVSYVNQYGGNSQYSRNTALHNACTVVGSANLAGCQQFVSIYGTQLTPLLHPGSDPIGTCRLIRVC